MNSESEKKRKKIVVVEDNDLNLKLFRDLLEANHYEVVSTQEGEKALSLIKETHPDLILMDIQLRGISGLDIIRDIIQDTVIGVIPIVAVTAFAMKDDREKILNSGCKAYISKPISIGPFLEIVHKFIGQDTKEGEDV